MSKVNGTPAPMNVLNKAPRSGLKPTPDGLWIFLQGVTEVKGEFIEMTPAEMFQLSVALGVQALAKMKQLEATFNELSSKSSIIDPNAH
jgi:hypothetical protein